MLRYKQLIERLNPKSPIIFTFGRFNPMTIGHEKLVEKIKKEGKKYKADPFLFPSKSHDSKKNPLDFKTKRKFLLKFFKGINIPDVKETTNPFTTLKYLSDQGYREVYFVVGGDRVEDFKKFDKYIDLNGGVLKFSKFKVISAGDRDPDSDDTSGASGTKMRQYVKNDDFETFRKYVPSGCSDKEALNLFNTVKKNLK